MTVPPCCHSAPKSKAEPCSDTVYCRTYKKAEAAESAQRVLTQPRVGGEGAAQLVGVNQGGLVGSPWVEQEDLGLGESPGNPILAVLEDPPGQMGTT